jgi:hypothetical protein
VDDIMMERILYDMLFGGLIFNSLFDNCTLTVRIVFINFQLYNKKSIFLVYLMKLPNFLKTSKLCTEFIALLKEYFLTLTSNDDSVKHNSWNMLKILQTTVKK